jgi:hypothetical protein
MPSAKTKKDKPFVVNVNKPEPPKPAGPVGCEEFENYMRSKGFEIREEEGNKGEWKQDNEVVEKLKELNDDNPISVDDSQLEERRLPPDPVIVRPYNADELAMRYKGDKEDMPARLTHKLLHLWIIWANLRTSPAIMELLNKQAEDKESDEHKVKCLVVDIVDAMAKALIDTSIHEEFSWLAKVKNKPDTFPKSVTYGKDT